MSGDQLSSLIQEMQAVIGDALLCPPLVVSIAGLPPESITRASDPAHRSLIALPEDTLTLPRFRAIFLKRRLPLVVCLADRLQYQWSPKELAKKYGSSKCVIEDCESGDQVPATLADFLKKMDVSPTDGPIWKIKASRLTVLFLDFTENQAWQDWPPKSHLQKTHGDLFSDFIGALPLPDYTHPDGPLNLASMYPKNCLQPDLGKSVLFLCQFFA